MTGIKQFNKAGAAPHWAGNFFSIHPFPHSGFWPPSTLGSNVIPPAAQATRTTARIDVKYNLLDIRRYVRIHSQVFWIIVLALIEVCAVQKTVIAADFSGVNLTGAHLTNADLRGADLRGAILTDANLSGTDLTGASVTQPQLDTACGTGTRLPAGLTIKPCLAFINRRVDAHRAERPPPTDPVSPAPPGAVGASSRPPINAAAQEPRQQVSSQSPEGAALPPDLAPRVSFKASRP